MGESVSSIRDSRHEKRQKRRLFLLAKWKGKKVKKAHKDSLKRAKDFRVIDKKLNGR